MSRIIKLITIFLLVLLLNIAVSINLFSPQLIAQTPQTISSLQRGINLYEAEEYQEALEVWNTALTQEQDRLTKALILNNVALASQNLGYQQNAETAISKSLEILNSLDIETKTYTQIKAKALNSQGYLQWLQGNYKNAITSWNLATHNYLKVEDIENSIKCQLNISKALQASGFSSKAKETLEQVYQQLSQSSNPRLKATGLQYLGNVLRKVGELQQSETVLQESLSLFTTADTLLELGNTEKALSDSYLATNQPELADLYGKNAIANYQQAFNSGNNLKAGLNLLSFAIFLGKWSDIKALIPQISQSVESLSFSRTGIYTRLNFIHSLSCLKQIQDNNNLACVSKIRQDKLKQILTQQKPNIKTPNWKQIARDIEIIIAKAPDSKTKSYSMGELGKIYESQQQWQLAQNYTRQALLTLESIYAPEISYRWQWQLGRILKQQGNRTSAIAAYTAAINNLKSVRSDLLIVNSEAQFSFRDNTEPIYRELVDLLLQEDGEVSQTYLEQAIESIDTLQLAEVENFLNCDLGSTVQLEYSTKKIAEIDPNAGFIYPIILEDRLEVIFNLPGQPLRHHTNFVEQASVKQTLKKLKRAILRGYPEQTIALSQTVYDWLIEPLELYLEENKQLNTLVFVLDGELRNIPMGVLYDSKQQEYLIQKPYALALLPSFQVFDLQTQPRELKVLGAGISEDIKVANKSFVGLNAIEELSNIENTLSSSILLNSQFTQPNIQKNLDTGNFSIVHLATHGNFSSNPEDTYIVVYDSTTAQGSLLKAKDLDQLLSQRGTDKPIDLLVLSACETAEGDTRATLGLAGIAVRAGTRSTLATLWQVSDRSTVELMTRFYQQLSLPKTSKAMALHHAQQALVNDPNYKAPYYWSPYVLVGNWR